MKDFRMPPQAYLQQLLSREDFLVFVAMDHGEVIGGLTAYTLNQYYSTAPLVYIFDLAVSTQFQRRGIGHALIKFINDYCTSIGAEEVFVQADQADDYALDFYRATGGTPEQVVHFTYTLKTS
ncbi:GNAT family N-acetyltransferase [Segetibacter sp. 3557_3]|nr:GNAT family N-acetyltransferase [Segetibacter sp. 3557_3]